MNREEIIKGLEECVGTGNCTECIFGKEKQILSCRILLEGALELIKRDKYLPEEEKEE